MKDLDVKTLAIKFLQDDHFLFDEPNKKSLSAISDHLMNHANVY